MDLEQIDREFGPAVRLIRQERNMSQEELATSVSKLGYQVSQATIGKIERGDRKVTIGEAEAIARTLGSGVDDLLRGAESRELFEYGTRASQAETEAINAFHRYCIAKVSLAAVVDEAVRDGSLTPEDADAKLGRVSTLDVAASGIRRALIELHPSPSPAQSVAHERLIKDLTALQEIL